MYSPIILQAGCTIGKPAESEAVMEQLNALLAERGRQTRRLQKICAICLLVTAAVLMGGILLPAVSLQPLGLTELGYREDVLGQVRWRLRQSYSLRRAAYAGAGAAEWLARLQNWLLGKTSPELEAAFAPGLRLWAQQGRLVNTSQPGTGIYELKIHVEYEKE